MLYAHNETNLLTRCFMLTMKQICSQDASPIRKI